MWICSCFFITSKHPDIAFVNMMIFVSPKMTPLHALPQCHLHSMDLNEAMDPGDGFYQPGEGVFPNGKKVSSDRKTQQIITYLENNREKSYHKFTNQSCSLPSILSLFFACQKSLANVEIVQWEGSQRRLLWKIQICSLL